MGINFIEWPNTNEAVALAAYIVPHGQEVIR